MRRVLSFAVLLTALSPACYPQETAGQDAKARRKAARELARQGSAAIPKLQTMLKDADLEVRIEAVKAIVEVDTQYSLEPLIEATRDNDPEIQVRATDGLVNFYVPGYVRAGLTASLRRAGNTISGRFSDNNDTVIDPYLEVRPEVIQALGRLARGGASMEARANAARAAGILRGKAAVPDLVEAIHSKDTQVIYECLVAFQKIGDRSVGPKIQFLLRDLDEKVQVAAVEAAGLLYNRDAIGMLREVLSRTGNKRVRRAALTSIAMLPDPLNRELFRQYLQDKDEDLREAAAEGLGRIANPADGPVIEKAFNDEKKNSPRVSLSFALVMMGRAELSEQSPLQYLVNTLNSGVRVGEARALLIETARKPEVRKALQQCLPGGTRSEKTQLAMVLAVSGDKDTIPALEALTHDGDPDVAREALRALRTLKARLP